MLRAKMTSMAGRKARNVPAPPLGEKGCEVARGCRTLQVEMTLYAELNAKRRQNLRQCRRLTPRAQRARQT